MKFLTPRLEQEWSDARLSKTLRAVVADAEVVARLLGWPEFTTTCIYRSPVEDKAIGGSGIHSEWRAIDIRTRGIAPEIVKLLTSRVNLRWIYDDDRPHMTVAYSEPHGTGPHLHLQVHAKTRMRNGTLRS